MGSNRPGTIGPHPLGLERSGRRPPVAFLFRAAKPAPAGGGKKLVADVAGTRSRPGPLPGWSSVRPHPNRGRGGRGSYRENPVEITPWLALDLTRSPAPRMAIPALHHIKAIMLTVETMMFALPPQPAATHGTGLLEICPRHRVRRRLGAELRQGQRLPSRPRSTIPASRPRSMPACSKSRARTWP